MNIQHITELANRLKGLMDDPHPGLLTWTESFQKAIEGLAEESGYTEYIRTNNGVSELKEHAQRVFEMQELFRQISTLAAKGM